MADELDVKVGADAGDATSALKDVANSVRNLQDQISGIQSALGGFRDKLLAAFSVDKIIEFGAAMIESASTTERLTAALGTTNAMVATLGVLTQASGGSVTGISGAFTNLSNVIARANAGVERSADELADLGLKAKDFQGLSIDEKFDLVAQKVSVLKDSTEKTAIVTALLGSAGLELLPILNQGAGALKEYREIMERAGAEQTDEFINEMGRLEMATIEMKASFGGLSQTIATSFASAFAGAANTVSRLVQEINNSIKSGGTFYYVVETLAGAAKGLASAFTVTIMSIQILWEAFKTAIYAMGELVMRFGAMLKAAFTLDLEGVKSNWNGLMQGLSARVQTTREEIGRYMKGAVDDLNVQWNRAKDDEEDIAQTTDANRRRRNQGAVAAALQAAEGEIRAAQMAYQRKAALLEQEVALGNLTQNQKFAALMQYNEQSYQAQLAALQRELAIAGLKPQQQQQINNRIRQLKAQHEIDMINLDRQSLQAQIGIWKQYTDTIANSFMTSMRGLITGMTTWSDALRSLVLDLGLQIIQNLAVKPAAEFIASRLAMLTASQTMAAGTAASEAAASAAALPAKVASFTSDITARAAQVFAGVFANLAPFMGPAAAGPAAASQAAVLAELVNVPKFDVGAWSVPRTGLAVIHAGETILPAGAPAEAYRAAAVGGPQGGGGGGGSPMQFVIHAMDGASVDRWLRNGGAAKIARATSRAQDKNPSLRPKT